MTGPDAPIPVLDLGPQHASLRAEMMDAIARVLDAGAFILGPEVAQFEAEVAAYLGIKHAIGVNSGTDALILALRALGIGSGDEVVTTPFSFFATAEAISHVGATPVFVDVDAHTFNLDLAQVEAKITRRTKALLPVHLFGRPLEMDRLVVLARNRGLRIVEDCAQSFGARCGGKQTGTFGAFGAYSFFPSKNLGGCGDGGLLVTDDDAWATTARMLRAHGSRKKHHPEVIGYNSRLDTLQAAILRVKLPHVDAWNAKRVAVARAYDACLADMKDVVRPGIVEGHVFHQYTIQLPTRDRDAVQRALAARGVHTMVYYPVPLDQLPLYTGEHPANQVSAALAQKVLSLPIWPDLPAATMTRVADALRDALV